MKGLMSESGETPPEHFFLSITERTANMLLLAFDWA